MLLIKQKEKKLYLNETMAEKQEQQKYMCWHIFELLLTGKFQHYL